MNYHVGQILEGLYDSSLAVMITGVNENANLVHIQGEWFDAYEVANEWRER